MACQPVSLLAWLRDNEPETVENIRWVFECKDYVRFRLTGEARAEITDYSGRGLMDLHAKSFSKELLALFGIESVWDALPPALRLARYCGAYHAGSRRTHGTAARHAGHRRHVRH